MRPSCLDCCRKHLAQALVLMHEAVKGYPAHAWLAVGHMSEAEDETATDFPELTELIREYRLEYMLHINGLVEDKFDTDLISIIEVVTTTYNSNSDTKIPKEGF